MHMKVKTSKIIHMIREILNLVKVQDFFCDKN